MRSRGITHRKPLSSRAKRWVAAIAIIAGTGLCFVAWYSIATAPTPEGWYRRIETRIHVNSFWSDGTSFFIYGTGSSGYVLKKLDAEGNLVWNQWSNDESRGYSVWGDGSWVYTCSDQFYPSIEKRDASTGQLQWNVTLTEVRADGISDRAIFGAGNAIYACGSIFFQLAVIKLNATSGAQLWNRTVGLVEPVNGVSVWTDGTFVFTTGYEYNSSNGIREQLLVKWDKDGNQLWNRTWDRAYVNEQMGFRISVWGDMTGNIYTLSSTARPSSTPRNQTDMLLIKWNADGDQLWNRTWGGPSDERGRSLWGDGTSIFTSGNSFKAIITKWESGGTIQWNQLWGSKNREYLIKSSWGYGTGLYTICYEYPPLGGTTQSYYLIRWDAATGATQHIIDVDWWLVAIVYGSVATVTIIVIGGGPAIMKAIKNHKKSRIVPRGIDPQACNIRDHQS
nr:hypothetical protein [Candidatus Sigynarchaeota archaeon]